MFIHFSKADSTVHDQTPLQGTGFEWNVLCRQFFADDIMYSNQEKKEDDTADLSFTSRTGNVQHFCSPL